MKQQTNAKMRGALIMILLVLVSITSYAQTAVQSWGQLRVEGANIVNENGEAVQLQGMSLFWSQWEPEFYEFNTIKWLRDDWCNNIVRATCGVEDNGSPFNGMDYQLNKARAVIDAAIALNIYVLVDWHAHYAPKNTEAAKTFFRTIAQEYGNHPNIIYEIFNEPIGYNWGEIKSYSEQIISEIRKYDPDNIIVCGTPQYSAYPDAVIGNAINRSNIAYTLHYYAASHFQNFRDRANAARSNGLCVFVTEYGLVEYTGNGNVNEGSSQDWYKWMNDNKISHCNWSLCDKNEGASALKPGTPAGGFWATDKLTWSGNLVRDHLKANCPTYAPRVPVVANIPGKVEAEAYSKMIGIQKETTTDVGGGQNIGYTDAGDYLEYIVNAAGSGDYEVTYRVAANAAASFKVAVDGKEVHTIAVNTGGWQKWEDKIKSLTLTAGEHTIRITAVTSGWNLNYLNFTSQGLVDCNGDVDGSATIDNCDVCSGGNTGKAVNACEGACISGLSTKGVRDDFELATDPYNTLGGVYAWGEPTLGGDDNPQFQALLTRNTTKKALEVKLSQGQGKYVPFGFSFGDLPKKTIDLTSNAAFEFVLKNTSTTDLTFALAIQDMNGKIINTSALASGKPFADAWKYGFSGNVIAGATYTFKGDLKGGFNADYTTKTYDGGFDFTKVTTILLTVTNQKNNGTPNYEPLVLANVTFEVLEFKVGDCSAATHDNTKDCNGDINGTASIDKCNVCSGGKTGITPNDCVLGGVDRRLLGDALSAFPNPANKTLFISTNTNWVISNLVGEVALTGAGEEILVEELKAGVYFLHANGEVVKFIKE